MKLTNTEKKKKYPATCMVHTPSGAVPACEEHAYQIEGLAAAMGWHVNRTLLTERAECSNCVNQND
jgi:hypothetical protein